MIKLELSARTVGILRRAVRHYIEHQPSGRWLITDPDNGKKKRLWLTGNALRHYQRIRGQDVHMRPYHRRWRFSRGGISGFIPSAVIERLITWAFEVEQGEIFEANRGISGDYCEDRTYNQSSG